jgi:hypothetical protein
MRRIIILTLIVGLSFIPALSQVVISIDSIVLNNAIEAKEKGMDVTGFGYGPVVTMSISVKNITEESLVIRNQGDYQMYCEYLCDGLLNKSLDVYFTINEDEPFSIPKDSTYKESITTCLFLPYNNIETNNFTIYDHLSVLKDVIDTFRLVLEINGTKYKSCNKPSVICGPLFYNKLK